MIDASTRFVGQEGRQVAKSGDPSATPGPDAPTDDVLGGMPESFDPDEADPER